jgi:hypothetical protein
VGLTVPGKHLAPGADLPQTCPTRDAGA